MLTESERSAFFAEEKRLETVFQKANKRFYASHIDLSAFESTSEPEFCLVPYDVAERFRDDLEFNEIPHRYYGPGTRATDPECDDLSYTMGIPYDYIVALLTVKLGYNRWGDDIEPAAFFMRYTNESVLRYCKGYTDPDSEDPFWKAMHERDRAYDDIISLPVPPEIQEERDREFQEAWGAFTAEMKAKRQARSSGPQDVTERIEP